MIFKNTPSKSVVEYNIPAGKPKRFDQTVPRVRRVPIGNRCEIRLHDGVQRMSNDVLCARFDHVHDHPRTVVRLNAIIVDISCVPNFHTILGFSL